MRTTGNLLNTALEILFSREGLIPIIIYKNIRKLMRVGLKDLLCFSYLEQKDSYQTVIRSFTSTCCTPTNQI